MDRKRWARLGIVGWMLGAILVVVSLFSVVDHTIPHNQGAFRPIHLIAPAGTIVNCDYPAPLSAGNTESHNLVAEVVVAALRQALPDRTTAPSPGPSLSALERT